MRLPAALLACPLIAGAVTGLLVCQSPDRFLPLCAAAGAVLAWLAAIAFFAQAFDAAVVVSVAIGGGLAGVALGTADGRSAYRTPIAAWLEATPEAAHDEPVVLEGVLRDDAALTEYGASMTIEAASVRVNRAGGEVLVRGGVRVSVGGAASAGHVDDWRAGRRIRVPLFLREPVSYGDPGVGNDARALARRGVSLLGSAKSAALVEVVARGGASTEAAAAVRAWARLQLSRHVGRWSPRSAAITSAILVGDRSGLSEDDERRLQKAGTYHVIAISGGNIAIVTAILLFVLRGLHAPPRATAAVAIVALLFYGEVAGAGASVSRAVTAAVIYLTGRLLGHRGPPLNALAVAAVALVAVSALAVLDPGFILSFGATLGILLAAARLLPAWTRRASRAAGVRAAPRMIAVAGAGLFAATASAELVLAPAGAAIFSRITFAGLVLNFAAIPLMTVVQAAAMASLAAAPLSAGVASACGLVAHLAASGLVRSAYLVDIAPWLSRDVVPPALAIVCVYYSACAIALRLPRHRAVALGLVVLCGAIMLRSPRWATTGSLSPPPSGTLRVVFFDVGQGDATLLLFPAGRALLVDAAGPGGSSFDLGERVVAPALRASGVRRLDVLALTHGDPDHVGGASSIVRGFRPGAVWEGVPVPPDPALRDLAGGAASMGATWRLVQAGDVERIGGVEIRILNPPLPEWERQRVRNDDSIVLDVRLGEVSVVLTGDIERASEHALASHLSLAPTVVLKAPHHGSATSSTAEFLAAVRPAAVVVSAGRANRFGHPAPVVVARYRAAGAPMLRTDRDGAVILDTDGTRVEITTWRGRQLLLETVAR